MIFLYINKYNLSIVNRTFKKLNTYENSFYEITTEEVVNTNNCDADSIVYNNCSKKKKYKINSFNTEYNTIMNNDKCILIKKYIYEIPNFNRFNDSIIVYDPNNNIIVGYLTSKNVNTNEIYISTVGTHPMYRQKSICKQMITYFIQKTKSKSYSMYNTSPHINNKQIGDLCYDKVFKEKGYQLIDLTNNNFGKHKKFIKL